MRPHPAPSAALTGDGQDPVGGERSAAVHPATDRALVQQLRRWAHALGFSQIGIAGIDLTQAEQGLQDWLAAGFGGDMAYMAAHGLKRARPAQLLPGTVSVITARMDYLPRAPPPRCEPADAQADPEARPDWRDREWAALQDPQRAVVSVYARGRDYHKVVRQRLQRLSEQLAAALAGRGGLGGRVFCDSAPVLEVELATRAGLGWRGKHTLALARDGGSMFFLGEIFVDRALPPDDPVSAHCGTCTACLQACPTQAIVAPYRLDARRCISYLTIEHPGAIPLPLRPLMGNRIYGCDDCQLVCPWNRWACRSALPDFDERQGLGASGLLTLWAWDSVDFDRRTAGSAIRRIGSARWRRNLAVALGNALRQAQDAQQQRALAQALQSALPDADALVAPHIAWALAQGAGATHGLGSSDTQPPVCR